MKYMKLIMDTQKQKKEKKRKEKKYWIKKHYKNKRSITLLTKVLNCTIWLTSFRFNKSKQQGGFHVHKVIFFVHFLLQFFFSLSFSISEVGSHLNVQ